MKANGLSDRQELFCQLYASDPCATRAAEKAGYSKRTAGQQGGRLLKNVQVRKRIMALQRAQAGARIADAREISETMTSVLRDPEAPSGSRLRAGELLLRAGGQFLIDDEPVDEPEDGDGGTRIIAPWVRQIDLEPFNSIKLEDGSVVPLSGAEDCMVWKYLDVFDPEQLAKQIATDETPYELDEPDDDEPVEGMRL